MFLIFEGVILTSTNGLNTLLSLRNALILNVKDPKPGKWTLRISGQGQHTIRITGLSSLDFVHGFASRSTLHFTETDARPLKGKTCYWEDQEVLPVGSYEVTSHGKIKISYQILGNNSWEVEEVLPITG